MIDFLSSEDFRFLWLPIITTVLTILIKFFYKDRRLSSVTWEDFAVAPNLVITALFISVIKFSLFAAHIKNTPNLAETKMDVVVNMAFVLCALLAGIISGTWMMREFGWGKKNIGQPKLKKGAIIISDIVGATYLVIAYNF